LEIEPIGSRGGSRPHDDLGLGVENTLRMFAEDIGVTPATLLDWRWVASRWPARQRRGSVPFYIHTTAPARLPEHSEAPHHLGKHHPYDPLDHRRGSSAGRITPRSLPPDQLGIRRRGISRAGPQDTWRPPDGVDEMDADYWVNGACECQGPATG